MRNPSQGVFEMAGLGMDGKKGKMVAGTFFKPLGDEGLTAWL